MTPSPRRRPARLATILIALVLAAGLLPATGSPAMAAPSSPPIPTGLPTGIESLVRYTPAVSCKSVPRPGTAKLAQLLTSTYRGTYTYITRACGPVPNSEHLEGRAIDWMNSVRNPQQAAQATAVLRWLLATDAAGNRYANARRLGVMYLIWNNQIWGAYAADRGWRPYANCSRRPQRSLDSVCHRNHIHLSLSWEGAMARTSYWTRQVATPDYGPCRPADLNWAYTYRRPSPVPCRGHANIVAPRGASTTLKALTQYSGQPLRTGSTGGAVKAVQRAIRVTADGRYGPVTTAAMARWQRAHRVTATGRVNATTWRALLKAYTPAGARVPYAPPGRIPLPGELGPVE